MPGQLFFGGEKISLCFLSISSDCCFSDQRQSRRKERASGAAEGEINKPCGSSSSTKDIYYACWYSEGFIFEGSRRRRGRGERERESCPVLSTLTVVVRDPSRVGCVVMFVHGKNV